MAQEKGFVVFQKNVKVSDSDSEQNADNDEEDIWDDSALIKAYDRAISAAKKQIAVKMCLTKVETNDNTENRAVTTPSTRWKVGDHCRAAYSVDGLDYEGTIKSVNPLLQTCVVHFVGYGNEEEVPLDSLKASLGAKSRRKQEQESQTYADEDGDTHTNETNHFIDHSPSKNAKQTRDHRPNAPSTPFSAPFPLPNPFSTHMPGPLPPIPPPPPIWPASTEDEGLYPMLMAWYMAGYHTGYYQGLQQQRPPGCHKH